MIGLADKTFPNMRESQAMTNFKDNDCPKKVYTFNQYIV